MHLALVWSTSGPVGPRNVHPEAFSLSCERLRGRALKLSSRHLFPSPFSLSPTCPCSPLSLAPQLRRQTYPVHAVGARPARGPYPAARSGVPPPPLLLLLLLLLLLRRRRRLLLRWQPNKQLRSDALRRRDAPVRGEVDPAALLISGPARRLSARALREPRDLCELEIQVSEHKEISTLCKYCDPCKTWEKQSICFFLRW